MTLPRIDQWVAALEARKEGLTDPQRIAEMDLLIEHLAAEGERDLPRTMATLSPRGEYHSWGGSSPYTATIAEQEELYRTVLERSENTFNLAMEIERCFSGPDGICVDGVLHKQATADEVVSMGHPLRQEPSRTSRWSCRDEWRCSCPSSTDSWRARTCTETTTPLS